MKTVEKKIEIKKEWKASLNDWRGSPRKFLKYLRAVQNKEAVKVSEQLKFVSSPYAIALRKLILSAVSNVQDASIRPSELIVACATVGRGVFLKRVRFCGRGKVGRVTKFSSNVSIVLRERAENGK